MNKILFTLIAASVFSSAILHAADLPPLQSDTEPNRIDWSQLANKFGPLPKVAPGLKIGGVSKTLTNEYWRTLGKGYANAAKQYGIAIVYQAAANEDDQMGQLAIAETLITQGFNGLLVSPITDANLEPAVETAKNKGVAVINVNDAVMPDAAHYVGNVQKDNGVRVAQWFIKNRPQGGKVAVIEGAAGVYAARQRTQGFRETIQANKKFQLVASVPANWSRETAYNNAATILQQHPDLIGFYANNDDMALGVVEAVRAAGLSKQVSVFGTDGISDAYASILRGELTGTVDSFPELTGEVAMDVAVRLIGGQALPRVVSTPQAIITKDNAQEFKSADRDQLKKLLLQN
jgi:ribose transport system substrate-binding protein